MSRRLASIAAICAASVLAFAPNAAAEEPDAPAPEGAAEAAEPEGEQLPWQEGPRKLELGRAIEMDLPAGYVFLAPPHAATLMESMGNLYNENLLGLIASSGEAPWFITLRFDEEGYVKDDESIDADELLESMRDGLDDVNEERKEQGFTELSLDGWDEKPHYDKTLHHLVWCLRVSDKDGASANYNTRVLGRKGYVSINLVTDPERVPTDKPNAEAILAATRFQQGGRYEDFDSSQDKVAEYGLAGLVAGGTGLGAMKLAKIGLMAKMWKVILAAVIAGKKAVFALLIGAWLVVKKLLNRGQTDAK